LEGLFRFAPPCFFASSRCMSAVPSVLVPSENNLFRMRFRLFCAAFGRGLDSICLNVFLRCSFGPSTPGTPFALLAWMRGLALVFIPPRRALFFGPIPFYGHFYLPSKWLQATFPSSVDFPFSELWRVTSPFESLDAGMGDRLLGHRGNLSRLTCFFSFSFLSPPPFCCC